MNKIREDLLKAQLAQLRAENRKLRRIAKGSGKAAKLDNIHRFAQHLLAMRFAGNAITQRAVIEAGFSRRWWQWGRALLMAAGVHDGTDISAEDFDTALKAVDSAAEHVREYGIEPLLRHMPPHCRLENYYKQLSKTARHNVSKNVSKPPSNNTFKSNSHSTKKRAVGEGHSRGIQRDRRTEIEQRIQMMEAQR